jgi:uncharacterized protein
MICHTEGLGAAVAPWMHLLHSSVVPLVFLVEGSRLFATTSSFHNALASGDEEAIARLRAIATTSQLHTAVVRPRRPTALSLNLAQSCNLACVYCYADQGRFGAAPQIMTEAVAFAAIDAFLAGADGAPMTLGFIGGEPFLARDLLHACVRRAVLAAGRAGIDLRFSVTTNGTLLTAADHMLLRQHPFAVTVSIDGGRDVHDRQRPDRAGRGSLSAVVTGVKPLLREPGGARLSARATIGRDDLRVAERIAEIACLGFRDVGVSPLRTAPDPALILRDGDWPRFLDAMVEAADIEWRRVRDGAAPRFANLWIALKEIHRGSAKPLPCGAALSYLSLDAEGRYHTCHRTIGDARFALGSLATGLDDAAREAFLSARHVDQQEPCRSCWARYLCGGGCHAEVVSAGRTGCEYIRGWLEYCLARYDEVMRERPELIGDPS